MGDRTAALAKLSPDPPKESPKESLDDSKNRPGTAAPTDASASQPCPAPEASEHTMDNLTSALSKSSLNESPNGSGNCPATAAPIDTSAAQPHPTLKALEYTMDKLTSAFAKWSLNESKISSPNTRPAPSHLSAQPPPTVPASTQPDPQPTSLQTKTNPMESSSSMDAAIVTNSSAPPPTVSTSVQPESQSHSLQTKTHPMESSSSVDAAIVKISSMTLHEATVSESLADKFTQSIARGLKHKCDGSVCEPQAQRFRWDLPQQIAAGVKRKDPDYLGYDHYHPSPGGPQRPFRFSNVAPSFYFNVRSRWQASVPVPQARQPFRFMDPPSELRLMVYERLPRETRHVKIGLAAWDIGRDEKNPYLQVVRKYTHTAILATCKLVFQEAEEIIKTTIRNFILADTPKVFLGAQMIHWDVPRNWLFCILKRMENQYEYMTGIRPMPD
jgi:hypothetical protein